MREKKTFFTVTYAVLVLALLVISSANSWLPAIGRWFWVPPDVKNAEAIAVLAGGGPERLCHGLELFKRGLAPELWYTGKGKLEQKNDLMDPEIILYLAERRGVPSEKIFFLNSTSTYEDALAIAARAKQKRVKSILLVTSWYHARRAVNTLRHCLPDTNIVLHVSSSTNLPYTPDNWWRNDEGLVAVNNEIIKTALYWRRYGIAPF